VKGRQAGSIGGMSRATKAGRWTAADVPPQTRRVAVITGSNTGIGYQVARVLAARHATVVLACRDVTKAEAAADRIHTGSPLASVTVVHLDLASLGSIRAAANSLNDAYEHIDLLINNAGLMMPPHRQTEDGFELQFGVNHLGPFALTGLLLSRMLGTRGSRVVTVSSLMHHQGRLDLGNLPFEHGYRRSAAYGRSKLANLLFTYELQRRLAAAGAAPAALAAHPGTSRTELTRHLPAWMRAGALVVPNQSSAMGALPTLRAATDPAAAGGEYYGPAGRGEFTGPARRVESSARSHDAEAARRLWDESERLTGVTYPV
jgi:NAD(P)-dependent dehydrogenase (short-subunit alcohol dehydrogenase family)